MIFHYQKHTVLNYYSGSTGREDQLFMTTVSDEGPSPRRPPPPSPIQLWEGGPLEEVGLETHVHKITNVPVFLYFISGPTPSNGPRNGWCPHQKHYVPRHLNSRYSTLIVIFRTGEGVGVYPDWDAPNKKANICESGSGDDHRINTNFFYSIQFT
jgi:hypothetical protein